MSPHLWTAAYIGVGGNLDNPARHVCEGMASLGQIEHTRLVLQSALYSSDPMGPPEQPRYINAAAAVLTQLAPLALLAQLQRIEHAHGRDRSTGHWGPRTLDLDLLSMGDQQLTTNTLTLPHPGLHERAFVLLPLMDIAPHMRVPGRGSVRRLFEAVDCTAVSVL